MKPVQYFLLCMLSFLAVTGCVHTQKGTPLSAQDFIVDYQGQVFLYGEIHGMAKTYTKVIDLWKGYYDRGMRHLFIELPYFTAEYLNIWMRSDNDSIIEEIYTDWEGTAAYNPHELRFYKAIKEQCPDTVFHGTDVGHQFFSTGARFLTYLTKTGQADSQRYKLTLEAIDQGTRYYKTNDPVYRENTMTANFLRELNTVPAEKVMGIYGSAHIGLRSHDFSKSVPCMANQLSSIFGILIESVDLSGF